MLERLTAAALVTAPAIWGKLPAHADYVRSGMRHGESEAWQPWLAEQAAEAVVQTSPRGSLPTAFVLRPGTLACARQRFVVGVITPSVDRVGRRHPLVVYQLARPRWVSRHFEDHAAQPREWLFWLARLVAAQVHEGADAVRLERSVGELWRVHAPRWREWRRARDAARLELAERRAVESRALIDRCGSAAPCADLRGVRFLPWVDWPQRLRRAQGDASFWQQDPAGGFVDAGTRLKTLWDGTR